jgi:hypothetical protein
MSEKKAALLGAGTVLYAIGVRLEVRNALISTIIRDFESKT